MSDILTRAVNVAEDNKHVADKLMDEILPAYFFLAYSLGEEKKDLKTLGSPDMSQFLTELYEKGKKIVKKNISIKECPKCHKEINSVEGVLFCQFCGEKLL